MFDAADLFPVVERYASFGDHHTGSDADRDTTRWLVDLLGGMGATVEEDPYTFERFVTEAELTIDGEPVPCLPLYYSGTGQFDSSDFELFRAERGHVGNAQTFEASLPTDGHKPLVIAIDGPDDLPVQCNRIPTQMLGRPAVVIAGNWFERVQAGAHIRFVGRLEAGQSANVIARFGSEQAPEVMITTPLTGWTPAAGERGTGLAVALAVAAALASDYRVVFSACSGHELDHIGLRHLLSTVDLAGKRAIHLGASIAATEIGADGDPALGTNRVCLTTAAGDTRAAIAERVPDANWSMPNLDPPWPGEGGTWLEAGAQVLSFLGTTSLFHTSDDVAAKATTPPALQLAAAVAIDATRLFLEGTR